MIAIVRGRADTRRSTQTHRATKYRLFGHSYAALQSLDRITRDPRDGPIVYSGSKSVPYRWFYPNTYRAFALPLEQSFDREVFGIPPRGLGRDAVYDPTEARIVMQRNHHDLAYLVVLQMPDRPRFHDDEHTQFIGTVRYACPIARSDQARRAHSLDVRHTEVRRVRHHLSARSMRRWRRSRSSAPAARCSPATCSATSSGYEELAGVGDHAVRHRRGAARRPPSSSPAASPTRSDAPAKITPTTDRRAALDGADYAINMIQVGGYEPCTVTDFEVPKQFGLRQTIADTLGIGGIMRGLRTIPVLLDMCADMEELCPDVWFLNYTNPMAINCRAISRASSIRTVGLCHSVQGTAFELSLDLGIPYQEIDYLAAGINHMAFYLRFERDGEDLYPRLQELARVGRGARRQPRALRGAEALRLLRHRVERALRRVRAVVHQARPSRPDRRGSTSRSTSTRAAASTQIAGWEAERARLERRRRDRGAARASSTRRRSSAASRPASRASSTATCRTTG